MLRLPASTEGSTILATSLQPPEDGVGSVPPGPAQREPAPAGPAAPESGADDVTVTVTGASQQSFPRIAVQFEVRLPNGSFLLDAAARDFRVTEEGRDVEVVEFQAPERPR